MVGGTRKSDKQSRISRLRLALHALADHCDADGILPFGAGFSSDQ